MAAPPAAPQARRAGDETVAQHCARTPTDCGTYRLLGAGLLRSADRIEMRTAVSGAPAPPA